MPIYGTGVTVEVQKTLAASVAITGISNASEAVILTANPPSAGDVVILTTSGGMGDINRQAVRAKTIVAGTSFVAEGLDTTNSGSFGSGSFQVVSDWDEFGLSQTFSVDEQSVDEIDITTLKDTQRQIAYGLLSAVKGSVGSLFEASDVALVNLRAATKAKSPRAFRVTFSDSTKAIFNGLVAIGDAFSMEAGGVAKSTCSFTLQGRQIMFYAT